jgi:hypothetical protein
MDGAGLLSSPRSHWAMHGAGVAGIWLVIWLTFWPSLKHAARDDQWNFLTDNRYERHFKRLVLRNYAFNRTSEMARGDYPLFRPILCGLLATEKALFDHRFVWWQIVGIAVHCAVVGLVLKLLLRLAGLGGRNTARTIAAYALALFFGLDVAVMELPIYHHLTGYMLFLLCQLGVVLLVLDLLVDSHGRRPGRLLRIGGAFLLALLGAFTYEIGQFFAVVVGLVLGATWWQGGNRRQGAALAALFCSVLIFFQLADRTHRALHPPRPIDLGESAILEEACSPLTLVNTARYFTFCIVQPFFPSCIEPRFASRLVIPEPADDAYANYHRLDPLMGVSLLVVLGAIALTIVSFRRLNSDPHLRPRLIIVFLALVLIGLHFGIIVLGRLNMRPRQNMLSMNSYYAYFPLAMMLVGLFASWSSVPATRRPRSERTAASLQVALAVGLLVLSAVSACKVHSMNVVIAGVHRPLRTTIGFLDKLVARHATDSRFGLAFSPEAWQRLDSFGHRYVLRVPLPVLLYVRHLNYANPTHVVTVVDGRWQSVPVEQYDGVWRLNLP